MGRKGWTIIIAMIVGAIIGAGIGYLVRHSALGAAVGAGTLAVGLGLIALVPGEAWEVLDAVASGCDCCSFFFVLAGAGIVTLGGLLLWHSLALATLGGAGMMTVLLVVLSALACSYKDASAVP